MDSLARSDTGNHPSGPAVFSRSSTELTGDLEHGGIRVDQLPLRSVRAVADQIGAFTDLPDRDPARQLRQQLLLRARQPEEVASGGAFRRRLGEYDPGLGVGEQALGQLALLGSR